MKDTLLMTDGLHTSQDASNGGRVERLAMALGLFSIGLGVAEIVAPRRVARLAGLPQPDDRSDRVLRVFGAREIASGLAILAQPSAPGPVWARVAGDMLDLYALRAASGERGVTSSMPAMSAAGLLGVTALDVYVAKRLSEHENGARGAATGLRTLRVHDVATINAPISDVYQFWRRFSFAQHMRHVDSVQVVDDRRSHWQVRMPAGTTLEWDAIITEDEPDSRIAWRSEPDAPIVHAGTVTFTPAAGGRGTELRVSFTYEPPGGRLGAVAGWLANGLVGSQIREDLRRCKQVIETGEVLLSDGPALWRPAQPAGDVETARTAAGVGR
jgi:uncharacterized membrane protein